MTGEKLLILKNRINSSKILSSEDRFQLGVKAIIKNNEGKILVLKSNSGKSFWDLPGGRLKRGEGTKATLLREVKEETGLSNLTNISYTGMILSSIRIPINQTESDGLIFYFYSVSVNSSDIKLSYEHQQYEWMDPEKAMELLVGAYGADFKQFVN